jgi:hypothetical protein
MPSMIKDEPLHSGWHCVLCVFLGSQDGYDLYWCGKNRMPTVVFGGGIPGSSVIATSRRFVLDSPLGEAFVRADVEGLVSLRTYKRLVREMENYEAEFRGRF